eukprot:Rhum_TRINITY_DN14161_c1_g1::Rhum_TRINITY_DN14161_c1_g1_i1::g.70235::m.70235/K15335/NSUN2; tRNA (cytosine34-C5)-methyltransferase
MAGGKRRWHGGGGGGGSHAKRARPQQDGAAAKADDEWLLGGTRGGATAADLKSDVLTRYYAAQTKVVTSTDEWEQILEAYRRPLNLTFRVADTGDGEAADTIGRLRGVCERVRQTAADGAAAAAAPRPVPWWPRENLCWEAVGTSRTSLARDAKKAAGGGDDGEGGGGGAERELFSFLVGESERGSVSRQEIVSMIPPLFLDARSDHFVLDCCAAPGNKTKQIMEALALDARTRGESCVSGCVVANDLNAKRCDILVTQTQRLRDVYPSTLVTNHNAALYPMPLVGVPGEGVAAHTVNGKPAEGRYLRRKQFDRILADVVCSGDGTFRKSLDLWKRWAPGQGNAVHKAQVQILLRMMELLKEGGRLVYSTCSMNPVEDEAVLNHCLRTSAHGYKLVDCSGMLPELKRSAGVNKWVVTNKEGSKVYERYADVPVEERGQLTESMFPSEDNEKFELQHGMRFKPHHQDTGGFFVAVLEKVKEAGERGEKRTRIPDDGTTFAELVTKKAPAVNKKGLEFSLFNMNDEEKAKVAEAMRLTEAFPLHNLFCRRTTDSVRRGYLFAPLAGNILKGMNHKVSGDGWPLLRVVAGGLRVTEKNSGNMGFFRATQEATPLLSQYTKDCSRRAVSRALMTKLVGAPLQPWLVTLSAEIEEEKALNESLIEGTCILVLEGTDKTTKFKDIVACIVKKFDGKIHLWADYQEVERLRLALGMPIDDMKAARLEVKQAEAAKLAAEDEAKAKAAAEAAAAAPAADVDATAAAGDDGVPAAKKPRTSEE